MMSSFGACLLAALVADGLTIPTEQLVELEPAQPAASSGSERVTATIGEGGRDLAPRLRVQGGGALTPAATLELSGDVGDNTALLGYSSVFYRLQPVFVAEISPAADVELFAGAGPGAAIVVDGVCSDKASQSCGDLAQDSGVELGLTGRLGARLGWLATPLVVVAQVDAIGSRGWTTTLNLALEVAR